MPDYVILKEDIRKMLRHQDKLNVEMAGKGWKTDKLVKPYRAAWVECAELMGWCDWEWWKKTKPNKDQQLIEMVDIFHFILGEILKDFGLEEFLLSTYFGNYPNKIVLKELKSDGLDLRLVENLVVSLIRGFYDESISIFFQMLSQMEVPFEQFKHAYFGKAILNQFRIDHGYKEGDYVKIWEGREDNIHMLEIVRLGGHDSLYHWLETRYTHVKSLSEFEGLGAK